jgi:glycosyltransferase involved in cell wall biosynthesis
MRRRILYVHHRSELGGAPTSLAHVIEALDPDIYDIHVYAPPGAAAERFALAGATVHTGPISSFTHIWASVYEGRRWLLFLRDLAQLPAHVIAFRRVLHALEFDLVHLNDSPLVAAAWLARREGIPVVWHLRSALPPNVSLRSRLLRRAIRRLGSAAIAINTDIAESFDVGAHVIPNTVDLVQFQPGDQPQERRRLGIADGQPVVGYFGFLYAWKGFAEFLRAGAMIRAAGHDAVFLVVGGAVRADTFFSTPRGRLLRAVGLTRNYEREARALVAQLSLEKAVRFLPFQDDTAGLYRACDVVVAPSQGPELPRSVLEAAACGVPVVTSGSKTGGGVIVPGETGMLTSTSPGELAAAVSSLLADDERRIAIGKAARRHAEARFSRDRNVSEIEEIYDELLPSDRTRVLFVHHRPQLGGAPTSLAQLIANLDERFEAHVYGPPGDSAELFASVGAVVHTGPVSVFVHTWENRYAGARWLVLLLELARLRPHMRELRRVMNLYRFPIVHLNDSPLLPAARVAKGRKAKVVWHVRSALGGRGRDARGRAISRLMTRWGDEVIAIDDDVAATVITTRPVTVIPNSATPIQPSLHRDEARKAVGVPPGTFAVGYIGFLRRPKGWPELVEAAAMLAERGSNVHFVIVGGGIRRPSYFKTPRGRLLMATRVLEDEESDILRFVRSRGLESRFSFVPFTSNLADIYAALDVVAFPNQGTGLGRPVLEAGAYGLPAIASGSKSGGGIIVPGETGLLLEDPTPRAIAAAVESLIADPALAARLGAAAAEHARRNFDPEQNARRVESVYDQLLGDRARRVDAASTRRGSRV